MADFVIGARRDPGGHRPPFATVGDQPARILVVMSPEVRALIADLHAASSPEERDAAWARHHSTLVPGPS